MIAVREITPEEREMLNGPTLHSQMPVVFANGKQFTEITAQCKQCSCNIAHDQTFGKVLRPFPQVAIVRGVTVCRSCKLLTPFEWRLHDDLRYSGLLDGKWVVNQLVRSPGLMRKLFRWLFIGPTTPGNK